MMDSDSRQIIEQLRGELADAERHIADQSEWIDSLLRQRATLLERIAALEAENERLKGPHSVTIRGELTPDEIEHLSRQLRSGLPHIRAESTGQHDRPPTRAETEANEDLD